MNMGNIMKAADLLSMCHDKGSATAANWRAELLRAVEDYTDRRVKEALNRSLAPTDTGTSNIPEMHRGDIFEHKRTGNSFVAEAFSGNAVTIYPWVKK